ncbi:MAG: NTP transferase domain-containing protein [Acidimicrobiaceae bacterium]|nr:NTP transferase domain-containing protein [Acidimicrobiaceae bacterium]
MVSLVVMAAGLGSRFGGTKQLAVVGADGEAFIDYAIRDAVDAGVGRVVLIVRSDIKDDVQRHIGDRYGNLEISYVCQDEHGPPRAKPWGTAHAVLAAAAEVDGPFIVCNADDYYGRSTYDSVVARTGVLEAGQALLGGFRLERTLPEIGEVSRGICTVEGDELVELVETHGISRQRDGSITATDPPGLLAPDAVVSMNFWALPEQIFDQLQAGFERFMRKHGSDEKAEFLLPSMVDELMSSSELKVVVIPTAEAWVGVTNPDDLGIARRRISELRTSR